MPTIREMKMAQKVPLKESGEPLVDVNNYSKDIIVELEETSKRMQGLKENKCFLRESAAKRLSLAQSLLPKGMHLKIIDGYRPLKAQRTIYRHLFKVLKKRHPKMSSKELEIETDKWVSNPDKIIPPHCTGGTVDLTIVDKRGKELEMGTPVNKVDKRSATKSKDIPKKAKQNRYMLIKVMGKSGFVNIRNEWWHWSYGDWRWAATKRKTAIYGAV